MDDGSEQEPDSEEERADDNGNEDDRHSAGSEIVSLMVMWN
jgi:hypothetical protein